MDNGLPESEEATAKELVSKAELQIHNNVLALIPEELTEVREQIQTDFDQSLEKDSTVKFEDLLLANKEMIMRDLGIDIDPQTQPEKIAAEYQDLFMKHGSIDHFDGVQIKNMVIELESRHEILMQDIGALPENASTIQTLEAIKALEKNEALAYAVAVAGSDDKSIQLRDTIAGDLHSFKGEIGRAHV